MFGSLKGNIYYNNLKQLNWFCPGVTPVLAASPHLKALLSCGGDMPLGQILFAGIPDVTPTAAQSKLEAILRTRLRRRQGQCPPHQDLGDNLSERAASFTPSAAGSESLDVDELRRIGLQGFGNHLAPPVSAQTMADLRHTPETFSEIEESVR